MQCVAFVLLALCGAALANPIETYDDLTEGETTLYNLCETSETVKCSGVWWYPGENGTCWDTKNCTKALAMETTPTGFEFYMFGRDDVEYVALAFSNDTGMGEEAVVVCIKNDTGVFATLAYNEGTKTILKDSTDGLTLIESKADNGVLYCKFSLADTLSYARQGSTATKYYLSGATGPIKDDGSLGMHTGWIMPEEMWAVGTDTALEDAFYEICEQETTKCAGAWSKSTNEGGACFTSKNCTKAIAMETNDDGHVFHLIASTDNDVAYVALGFSNDTSMGQEAVVACVIRDDKLVGELSFDPGYSNVKAESDEGLTVQEAKVEDGIIYCKFVLENPLSYAKHEELFADEEYYIIGAAGKLNSDGSLGHHSGNIVSDEKWKISSSSALVSSAVLAFSAFLITYNL